MPRKKKTEEEVKTEEVLPKALSEAEMRQLEAVGAAFAEKQARVRIATKEVEASKLKAEILKFQIADAERAVKDAKDQMRGEMERYQAVKRMLQDKYSLSEKWGYDPDTGEIGE